MHAIDLITADIPPLRPQDDLSRALDWLEEFKVGHLPVVDNGRLVGMVREQDVVDRHEARGTVSGVMDQVEIPFIRGNQHIYDVMRLFTGRADLSTLMSTETTTVESAWADQHPNVIENFSASILSGAPLVAPVGDGLNGVRLANGIHLSAWTGEEVSLDPLDETRYLAELNARIAAEGRFDTREA